METYDVVIAGGGPGGSAAATHLARAGRRVLLLEREHHPRFRIGESLLPYGNDLLQELGVWDRICASGGFMPKRGAEFCTADGARTTRFSFECGLGPRYGQTFQVERARFDEILFTHARESGAETREGAAVTRLSPHEDHVEIGVREADGERAIRADWFIDASGRDAVAGRLLNLPRRATQSAKRVATYAHFRGVFRNDGDTAGNITIARLPGGWFWFIPLDAEKTSVGFVRLISDLKASGRRPEEDFAHAVAAFPGIAERMRDAERVGDFHTTGDYSYRFETFAPHPRVLLAGDAAGFVDPIFSSGVMLALKSARLATQLISAHPNRPLDRAARARYTREVNRMMQVYVRMISAFYDERAFEIFMDPQPVLNIPSAVAAVVGGNTDLPFRLRWRLASFYLLCRLQRWIPLAPRIPSLAIRRVAATAA